MQQEPNANCTFGMQQESKPAAKAQKPRWNIFQRGTKNKSNSSLSTLADPAELQRVSFATSINDLPERPSAFKQVLGQIGAQKGAQKMKRVHSFKKLARDRDGRCSSPQGRLSVGSATSANLDVASYTGIPRSSSNSSFHGLPTETKSLYAEEHTASNNNTDGRNNTDNRSSTPAAGVLLSEAPIQPSAAPVLMSGAENGNQSLNVTQYDTVDGSPSGEQQRNRNSVELDHIQQKILKISEAIKLEQATRDSNVADYLKLTTNADKQQTVRIKTVFEKKNQKSNATITQLQKKLETYHRRLRELESNGGGRQGRLRDVGANLRDFSGGVVDSVKQVKQATQNAAGAIVSKPKGLATKLKNKFGSVDNLNSLPYEDSNDEFGVSNDEVSSTSGSIDFPGTSAYDELPNQHSSVHSGPESPENGIQGQKSQTQQLHALAEQLMTLQSELEAIQRSRSQFESSWDLWKNQANDEITFLTDALREERHRYERLEVQLNDLTERHQHEVSSLKQDLTSMEEKVEYHARERERDMQEAIENCQTRLAKMELQQQQLVAVEGLENANARALLGKLINLLLSVLAVVLVFVSTISGLITPLMRSPARIFSTIVAIFALVITYKNWDNFVNWYMGSHR